MIPLSSPVVKQLLIVIDALCMLCAFVIATLLSNGHFDLESLAQFFSVRIKVINFLIMIGFAIFWNIIFSKLLLYDSNQSTLHWDTIKRILKAVCFGTAVLFSISLLFAIEMINPWTLLAFLLLSMLGAVAGRVLFNFFINGFDIANQHLRYALIIGTNQRAVAFAKQLEEDPKYGYCLLGFVDEDTTGRPDFSASGYSIVATFTDFKDYIRHHTVDEVFIALPLQSHYAHASSIANCAEEQGIATRYVGELFTLKRSSCHKQYLLDASIVSCSGCMVGGWQTLVKRLMDIVLSAALLVLLSPLLVLVAILIKVDSPGPVFFIQQRIGLNKRRFALLKFRSMCMDAEQKQAGLDPYNQVSGPVFKMKNDPRITWVGKLIRRTSIDELPQLINVFIGDMSLVGPRPLPIRDYNGFTQDWQRRRFSVKPGLTCLWQVSGRNEIQFYQWMALDLAYIDHWSIWLDVKILLLTVPAVVKCDGAV